MRQVNLELAQDYYLKLKSLIGLGILKRRRYSFVKECYRRKFIEDLGLVLSIFGRWLALAVSGVLWRGNSELSSAARSSFQVIRSPSRRQNDFKSGNNGENSLHGGGHSGKHTHNAAKIIRIYPRGK